MEWNRVSRQLQTGREKAGLSLAELARRADTSAATLSRYENGWGRFEVYTLRKLATALGCRLVIRLQRVARPRRKPGNKEAVAQLGRLFWDHDLSPQDLKGHPEWIVERVIECGSLSDVWLLIDLMGRETFLERVRGARFHSAKTRNFWMQMLDREDLTCTRKSSPNAAWSC